MHSLYILPRIHSQPSCIQSHLNLSLIPLTSAHSLKLLPFPRALSIPPPESSSASSDLLCICRQQHSCIVVEEYSDAVIRQLKAESVLVAVVDPFSDTDCAVPLNLGDTRI